MQLRLIFLSVALAYGGATALPVWEFPLVGRHEDKLEARSNNPTQQPIKAVTSDILDYTKHWNSGDRLLLPLPSSTSRIGDDRNSHNPLPPGQWDPMDRPHPDPSAKHDRGAPVYTVVHNPQTDPPMPGNIMGQSMLGGGQGGKNSRRRRACQRCYEKKIKCDSENNPCLMCSEKKEPCVRPEPPGNIMGQSMLGGGQGGHVSRKNSVPKGRACEACRTKKLRCDSVYGTCQRCIKEKILCVRQQ